MVTSVYRMNGLCSVSTFLLVASLLPRYSSLLLAAGSTYGFSLLKHNTFSIFSIPLITPFPTNLFPCLAALIARYPDISISQAPEHQITCRQSDNMKLVLPLFVGFFNALSAAQDLSGLSPCGVGIHLAEYLIHSPAIIRCFPGASQVHLSRHHADP